MEPEIDESTSKSQENLSESPPEQTWEELEELIMKYDDDN